MNLAKTYELEIGETKNIGDDLLLVGTMPLSELMRGFDNSLKSVSAGYASFNYQLIAERPANVEKLEILINDQIVQALTRIVQSKNVERESRITVEKLRDLLPKEQFRQIIQAKARGRIMARETISALRKDVTGYLYGGDRSRKMKLWKKQKRGKKKLEAMGRISISPEVIREILKK